MRVTEAGFRVRYLYFKDRIGLCRKSLNSKIVIPEVGEKEGVREWKVDNYPVCNECYTAQSKLGFLVCWAHFTHFSKKRWVLFYYRGQKLGSRVNFLDVLKYPEYENRIFRVSYICMDFVIRTSLSVFDRLSWNLDMMCKYGWNCAK